MRWSSPHPAYPASLSYPPARLLATPHHPGPLSPRSLHPSIQASPLFFKTFLFCSVWPTSAPLLIYPPGQFWSAIYLQWLQCSQWIFQKIQPGRESHLVRSPGLGPLKKLSLPPLILRECLTTEATRQEPDGKCSEASSAGDPLLVLRPAER